jgi:putative flippase GtrA
MSVRSLGAHLFHFISEQSGEPGRFRFEAIRFLLVGGANFVLTFIVFFLLFKILQINYMIALSTSWGVGMLFSYALNFTWVFKPEEQLQFKARLVKYFLANLISLLLNLLTLRWLVNITAYDPFWVQCALIPMIVIFNFSTAKFWSLRRTDRRRQ